MELAKDMTENQYRRNAYFIDPNGYEIEFVEYLSDIPEERNINDSYYSQIQPQIV